MEISKGLGSNSEYRTLTGSFLEFSLDLSIKATLTRRHALKSGTCDVASSAAPLHRDGTPPLGND
jgi:hypothetical protein